MFLLQYKTYKIAVAFLAYQCFTHMLKHSQWRNIESADLLVVPNWDQKKLKTSNKSFFTFEMAKETPDMKIAPWVQYENKNIGEILAEKKSCEKSGTYENSKSTEALSSRRKSLLSSIKMSRNKKSTDIKSPNSQTQSSLTRSEARNEINHSTEVTCISCFGKF